MFLGFFKNADYSRPEVYLKQGTQTKFLFNKAELEKFKQEIGEIKTDTDLFKIIDYINFNKIRVKNNYDQFGRTAKEIFESKVYTGCTDYALVFETITRQLNIPTVHVQLADIDWINDLNSGKECNVRGHHVCECLINNKWVYVDVALNAINGVYDVNNFTIENKKCFAKSLDCFETGIHSLKENNEIMKQLFLNK